MDHTSAIEVIRQTLADVEIEEVVIEFDPAVDENVAKIVVREDQLDAACRGNGELLREAAMKSGIAVEIVLKQ